MNIIIVIRDDIPDTIKIYDELFEFNPWNDLETPFESKYTQADLFHKLDDHIGERILIRRYTNMVIEENEYIIQDINRFTTASEPIKLPVF